MWASANPPPLLTDTGILVVIVEAHSPNFRSFWGLCLYVGHQMQISGISGVHK